MDWLAGHAFWDVIIVLVAYWIVSAIIDYLPAPNDRSSGMYTLFFKLLSIFGANLHDLFQKKPEEPPSVPDPARKNIGTPPPTTPPKRN